MYDALVEKLVEVGEAEVSERPAVATEVDPQQAMRLMAKKYGITGKLQKATYPGVEGEWYKFWLLTDGKLIPVEDVHEDTTTAAGVTWRDLFRAGAVPGYVDASTDSNELSVSVDLKFTQQQITTLTSMQARYSIRRAVLDIDNVSSFKQVKSSDELNYFLMYGDDSDLYEAIEVPEYLYHGTFKPLLDKIKSEGLRTTGIVKNYSDSEEGLIYLAKTFEEAEAFAEVSETVPDEWIDQVVVLRIETDKLDKSKLADDPNVRDTEVMTFIYPQDILPEALEVVTL